MKDIIPILQKSGEIYNEKTVEIFQHQLQTIDKINNDISIKYKEMEPKVQSLKDQNKQTLENFKEIENFSENMNKITEIIDQMEIEEKELNKKLDKIESKYKELKNIQLLMKEINKQQQINQQSSF